MTTFEVVSDLICPWCYVGKRRLEAALRQLPPGSNASVSWHPFQLNPDMPARGMNRKEYCMRKFGSWERCLEMYARIAEVGQTVGIEFNFEEQSTVPNTLDAHRVIWLAGLEGVQDTVVEALFHAYFCEGTDLSLRANLIEVCVPAGLDPSRVEDLFATGEGSAEVLAEEQEIKSLGLSSVPLFIIQDQLAVSGAQPPEVLLKAFEQAQAIEPKRRTVPVESVGSRRSPEGCDT